MVGRLTDVADKVGVSEATVSRVLNGRPGVSEATRKAVLTALDVLGYERPTKLRGERARLVGLVLPELQNPIFPAFADVVGGSLAQQGLTPVLCTHTAGLSEADYVELLFEQHVSGVLFAGGNYSGTQRRARPLPGPHRSQAARPCSSTPASTSCRSPGCPATTRWRPTRRAGTSCRSGTRASGSSSAPTITCRRCGGSRPPGARLEGAGLELGRDQVEFTRHSLEGGPGGRGAAARAAGVTGVVCGSDPTALGAIRATKRAGLSVPRDLSVVGYDDSAFMNCTEPPADHGPPADRGDGPGGGRPARRASSRASTSVPTSCCSSPSWSSRVDRPSAGARRGR